jgi:hypothetical protein
VLGAKRAPETRPETVNPSPLKGAGVDAFRADVTADLGGKISRKDGGKVTYEDYQSTAGLDPDTVAQMVARAVKNKSAAGLPFDPNTLPPEIRKKVEALLGKKP